MLYELMSLARSKKVTIILSIIGILLLFLNWNIIAEYLFAYTDKDGNLSNNPKGELLKFIGIAAAAIAALYGLYLNTRTLKNNTEQLRNNTEQLQLTKKQLQITEKYQINTRFKDAAQLLGSENSSSIICGVYALYQIAIDVHNSSDQEYKGYIHVINDILSAYLRENSISDDQMISKASPKERKQSIEVFQIIIDKLLSKTFLLEFTDTDLSYTYLSGLNLEKLSFINKNLEKANFDDTNLKGTSFKSVNLKEAKFVTANLESVTFEHSDLQKIHLYNYNNLPNIKLRHVDLQEADLYNINMQNACLSDVIFSKAKLDSVSFAETILTDIDFSHAELKNINFSKVKKFININFSNCTIDDKTNFNGTVLASYSIEETTRPGRSLELTRPKE